MTAGDVAPPSPFGKAGVRAADLDFDKRIDIVQSLEVGGSFAYRIWFNLGDRQYAPSLTLEPDGAFDLIDPTVQIADFYGDRVPDLVQVLAERLRVKAGLGYGRFAAIVSVAIPDSTLSPDQLRQAKLTDVTGDGLADVVIERAGPGRLWYWINQGNYKLSGRKEIVGMPVGIGQRAVVRWADMNGNGTTDLVYADSASEPRLQTIDVGEIIGCGATPNILASIANGMGRTITIAYASSIDFRLADEEAGRPWPNLMPFAVPVVASVRVGDSLGHEYRTEYRYHDGYYDPREKQFRGFARVEQIEVGDATAPTLVSRSFFDTGHVHQPMKGKLLRQVAEEEDGRVYWDESTQWTLPPVVLKIGTNGQSVLFVHPLTHTRTVKELGRGTERIVQTESAFDGFGNQTLSANYGMVEGANREAFNDERITRTEYAFNLEKWIVRLPRRSEITDERGAVISRTEFFYDDPGFSGTNPGQVSVGDLTMTRDWIAPDQADAFVTTSRTRFDAFGNAVMLLDPLASMSDGTVDLSRGHVRTITHDDRFHAYPVTETVHIGAGSAPLVYRVAYDADLGRVMSSTDFNSNTTSYTYDAFARLTAMIRPGDTSDFPTSEYSYLQGVPTGANGRVSYIETRLLDQPPGSLPRKRDHYLISRDFLDGLGRSLMSKKEGGSDGGGERPGVVVQGAVTFNARTRTAADLNPYLSVAGNTLEELLEYENIEAPGWKGLFQEAGALMELGLQGAHQTATRYDAALREVRGTNPDGTFETTAYEPFVTRSHDASQTDPASPFFGAFMAHHEDGLGRLIRVDEVVRLQDDGTTSSAPNTWTTRYEYDLNDQLVRITDSQNNVKRWSYDGLMRKVSMDDPDRGSMRFRYDAASNLIETTDAKGQQISHTYDGANRLRSEDLHDGNPRLPDFDPARPISGANRPDVAYFYDVPVPGLELGDGSSMTGRNTGGLLSYTWDLSGEEHYSYDAREQAVAVVKRVRDPATGNLASYRTGYLYDSLDRLTRVVYPDNDVVLYEYNERGLGRRILGAPGDAIVSNMLYSPAGLPTLIEYGNGIQTTNRYDNRLRLRHTRTLHSRLGTEIVGFEYQFDAASKITSITDVRSDTAVAEGDPRRNTQFAGYDDLSRLTSVRFSHAAPGKPPRNDGEIHYRYDRIGNMLPQTSTIEHMVDGVSATSLGDMTYGGGAGRANRIGRTAIDPPGPHALTSVSQDVAGPTRPRSFSYDANGNMVEVDGLRASWDFKDRLTSVVSAEETAEYTYDHRDRRVYKRRIRQAPPGSGRGRTEDTIYVDQYFEIRDGGLPVKYVWNGNTRVARVTGMISAQPAVQRIRLRPGWNLCAIGVTAERAGEQLSSGGAATQLLRWDPMTGVFKPLLPAETVPAGTVLWVQAASDATVALRGTPAATRPAASAPAGGGFHPGDGRQNLDLERFAPAQAAVWRWDAAAQRWQVRLPDSLAPLSDPWESLPPGEAVFVGATTDVPLSLPDQSLRFRYYHQDHLGSSAAVADADGRLLEETSFYPFGLPRYEHRPFETSDPYQFTQKERDAESGWNYLEARFQSPLLGRFLRVDPLAAALKSGWLEEPQRLNLYAYAANSPLGNSDPSGTDLVAAFKGFAIGTAESVWEAGNPLNAPTMLVSATVSVGKVIGHKAVMAGNLATATYKGDYKEALKIAFVDERLVKILDPKTSDEEVGRTIGQTTGQALVAIATSKAGPAKEPSAPAAPPARVVVGPPMSGAGQLAKTQPVLEAPKTLRDPTLQTGPANEYGFGRLAYKRYGFQQRVAWLRNNAAKAELYGEEWSRRVKEARPEMDRMIEQTGSAKSILKKIGEEVEAVYGGWD